MVLDKKLAVLVTGGAGYIGSHVVLELLRLDHDVIVVDSCVNVTGFDANEKCDEKCVDIDVKCAENGVKCAENGENCQNNIENVKNWQVCTENGEKCVQKGEKCEKKNSNRKPVSIERVEKLANKSVKKFFNFSIADTKNIRNIFETNAIDVVIHFAALKAVGESVEKPLRYYSNNVTGIINLLEVMHDFGVKKMIFSSSATVYGDPQYLPLDEKHPTGQSITNPYGQSKYMCEKIMKDLTVADKEWQIVFLRYFNPVGADESGVIGEDPRGIPNNLMPYVSQVAVGKLKCLEVFGNDYDTVDGTGVRDYIHVTDLAKGHVCAFDIFKDQEFYGWKAFNLGTGSGASVLEIVNAFSKVVGKPIDYKVVGRREGDVATVLASCDLAHKHLNWRATRNLQKMCEDTWRWQMKNPTGYV